MVMVVQLWPMMLVLMLEPVVAVDVGADAVDADAAAVDAVDD